MREQSKEDGTTSDEQKPMKQLQPRLPDFKSPRFMRELLEQISSKQAQSRVKRNREMSIKDLNPELNPSFTSGTSITISQAPNYGRGPSELQRRLSEIHAYARIMSVSREVERIEGLSIEERNTLRTNGTDPEKRILKRVEVASQQKAEQAQLQTMDDSALEKELNALTLSLASYRMLPGTYPEGVKNLARKARIEDEQYRRELAPYLEKSRDELLQIFDKSQSARIYSSAKIPKTDPSEPSERSLSLVALSKMTDDLTLALREKTTAELENVVHAPRTISELSALTGTAEEAAAVHTRTVAAQIIEQRRREDVKQFVDTFTTAELEHFMSIGSKNLETQIKLWKLLPNYEDGKATEAAAIGTLAEYLGLEKSSDDEQLGEKTNKVYPKGVNAWKLTPLKRGAPLIATGLAAYQAYEKFFGGPGIILNPENHFLSSFEASKRIKDPAPSKDGAPAPTDIDKTKRQPFN